jgi:hypothetical protein
MTSYLVALAGALLVIFYFVRTGDMSAGVGAIAALVLLVGLIVVARARR